MKRMVNPSFSPHSIKECGTTLRPSTTSTSSRTPANNAGALPLVPGRLKVGLYLAPINRPGGAPIRSPNGPQQAVYPALADLAGRVA